MNTYFQIELLGQAEKNRVLDGIRMLINRAHLDLVKIQSGPQNRWTHHKYYGQQRHIRYLEALYLRIKLTKGKKPKDAFKTSNLARTSGPRSEIY